jgi:hypothetical protein
MDQESTTIDEIHDSVDALVLSVFEAMRLSAASISGSGSEPNIAVAAIHEKLLGTCSKIDKLVGIDRSSEERTAVLHQLSTDYQTARDRTLCLEKQLLDIQASVDARIARIVDNPSTVAT